MFGHVANNAYFCAAIALTSHYEKYNLHTAASGDILAASGDILAASGDGLAAASGDCPAASRDNLATASRDGPADRHGAE